MGDLKVIVHDTADGIGLDEIAADNLGDHENGAENSQPWGVKPLFDVIHRAAYVGAVFVLFAIHQTQDNFTVLGCHAHESGNPHPENCPQAAG